MIAGEAHGAEKSEKSMRNEEDHVSVPNGVVHERPRVRDVFDDAKRNGRPVNVCAPMVRYSKLPFRLLLRDYNVDVVYTPMMLAHEFIRSQTARDSDFTTCALAREPAMDGRPRVLIAQFASSDPMEFARAAELISPWVDGVDLNCGCPQSWAIKEGIGCSLMENPDLVAGIVKSAKACLPPSKSVSCKIRIHKDLERTLRWVRTLEEADVDFITVHGRTRSQRSSTPPNYEAIRMIKSLAKVPILANGDAYSAADVSEISSLTGVDGVMAARGILENPALFTGHDMAPPECVRQFLEFAIRYPIPYALVLHHISEMTGRMPGMTKVERRRLMQCKDVVDMIDFVQDKWPS